ncbi:uncharacterized protein N7473_011638 [Penicillium subrubescens]|uniref:Uncharacterized protein n=1 Tax=Penicillium subrubescens TaxID=1316194 RepID=A0A1Q5TMJ1_9EURO|nr:uncharacterized protein N7473_011638 [Penicillium subrubescens]KAJ5880585.1 hypothetical protein N7473_011638 [Penicillium subrubescens]OKP01439.1 hypothetical protein PENSUB_7429 [Penicillium subrubescens]
MLTWFEWGSYRNRDLLYYRSDTVGPREIIELLLAEHALRELKQREEALKQRSIALQKAKAIESDSSELEDANAQLDETRKQIPRKEHDLYGAVSMLTSVLRKDYDSLRRNTKWFMRKEMVQDCSDRGGCCSRGCGCCSQRHLSKGTKGDGHCTTECWCCTAFRGFEISKEDKIDMVKDFQSRLERNRSGYLIDMADWFFSPLPEPPAVAPKLSTVASQTMTVIAKTPTKDMKTPTVTVTTKPLKPRSRWQKIFGRNK